MSMLTDVDLYRCGIKTLLASWEEYAHGATGAEPNVIEIHPVLKIEWL